MALFPPSLLGELAPRRKARHRASWRLLSARTGRCGVFHADLSPNRTALAKSVVSHATGADKQHPDKFISVTEV